MESRFGKLAGALKWLKDGLFPLRCLNCGVEGEFLCEDCVNLNLIERADFVCPFCHSEDREGKTCGECSRETFLDGAISLGFYHDKFLQKIIHAWKFEGSKTAAKLVENWLDCHELKFMLPPVDWYVTSIPLHEARLRERGFNQAEEIAKLVALKIGAPHIEFLARPEWTDPQARRNTADREVGDLDGIFSVIETVPPCVLICDDVLTSGATMDAAARVLKEHGAQIVWGFSLARAGR
jgi:predicted amidophosphoribosyltransferase